MGGVKMEGREESEERGSELKRYAFDPGGRHELCFSGRGGAQIRLEWELGLMLRVREGISGLEGGGG